MPELLSIATRCPQATRQSMLKKYGEIRHAMDRLHNTRLSNYERLETLDEIRRQGGGPGFLRLAMCWPLGLACCPSAAMQLHTDAAFTCQQGFGG